MGYAKPTAARLIDQRARRRACQALIEAHPDEFHELYDQFRGDAEEEAERLAAVNATLHGAHADSPPRIKTGRRKPGQDTTERIDLARCPQCVSYHDSGHACPNCGSEPDARKPVPPIPRDRIDAAILRMVDQGHHDAKIAFDLRLTEEAVRSRRNRLGQVAM